MDIQHIITFVVLLIILVVTPGPGMVNILATVSARGLKSGLILIAGITSIHVIYVIIISASFALVFDYILPFMPAIQMIGGSYIIYLGYKQYKGKRMNVADATMQKIPFFSQFALGIASSLSNPKIVVFYFSVLPNFIDLGKASWRDGVILVLVVLLMIGGQLSLVCVTANYLRKKILNAENADMINHIAGVVLMMVGAYLIAQII